MAYWTCKSSADRLPSGWYGSFERLRFLVWGSSKEARRENENRRIPWVASWGLGVFSRKLSLQKTYRRTLTWAWHGCSRRVRRKSNAWETGNGLRNVISRELRIIGLRDHTIYSQFPTRRLESLMALIKWSRGVRSGAARDCGPIFTDLTRGRISRIGEVLWLHDQYLVTCRLVFQFKISLQTSEA